jgi:hypothetical protein
MNGPPIHTHVVQTAQWLAGRASSERVGRDPHCLPPRGIAVPVNLGDVPSYFARLPYAAPRNGQLEK